MVNKSRNFLITLKSPQQIRLKLLRKKSFKKKVEASDDLNGNKTANKITKLSKYLQQNNSETFTIEHDKELIICVSRRNARNYWWTKIKIK